MSDTYKPESLEALWKQAFTPIQNAYNSGYIIGVEQGERLAEERIIKLLEDNHLTAASELIEQDALIKGENK